ncbi:MAG: S24 family peptidase [Chitinophagaceae bacterium]|nr:MAG: S24 family peptidase [Chitinophagaceae bacterium]
MEGHAMKDAGIFHNDILIVDRSVKTVSGKIVIAYLNGEVLVRKFHKNFSSAFLTPENDRYNTINLSEFGENSIWGGVIHSIHALD